MSDRYFVDCREGDPSDDKSWRWSRVDEAKPGEILRTPWDDNARVNATMFSQYSVQNVLLAQLDFNLDREPGIWRVSAYHDRLPFEELRAITARHLGSGILAMCRWTQSASKEKLHALMEDICGLEWCGSHSGVKGFRIMRHTNVSNGYPVYTFEAWGKEGESSHV